jgi:hypothetical protein
MSLTSTHPPTHTIYHPFIYTTATPTPTPTPTPSNQAILFPTDMDGGPILPTAAAAAAADFDVCAATAAVELAVTVTVDPSQKYPANGAIATGRYSGHQRLTQLCVFFKTVQVSQYIFCVFFPIFFFSFRNYTDPSPLT